MNTESRPAKTARWKTFALFSAMTIGSACVGIALALLLVQLTSANCVEGPACLSNFYALTAGIALTQAVNLPLIYLLMRRRRKRQN